MTKKKTKKKSLKRAMILAFVLFFMLAEGGIVMSMSQVSEAALVKKVYSPQGSFAAFNTFEEARRHMIELEDEFMAASVLWASPRGNIEVPMKDFKLWTNVIEMNSHLTTFMDTRNSLEKLLVMLHGEKMHSYLEINLDNLTTPFEGSEINQEVKNAAYYWEGQGLKIAPEQTGYRVDTVALAEELQKYWAAADIPTEAPLPMVVTEPEVTSQFLQEHIETATALARRAFTLQDPIGDKWTIEMYENMHMVEPQDGFFKLKDEEFEKWAMETIAPEVETQAKNVTITESEDGNIEFEGSARRGRLIDYKALKVSFEEMLNNPETTTLIIPIIETEPVVNVPDSLKEKGITDLVGVGYSNFYGSPWARIQNVNRGMQQFNGTLIAPGEEFSFTTLMGPIDAANGWLPELVIKGDDTIPEYGGGLCQVSSTMFRAALYSGLDITARKNHSYAVSYYAHPFGYGLDATIYDPAPDFRFTNDTQGYILIQGYTEGNAAYFVFYGTYDGRSVAMEGPFAYNYHKATGKQIEYSSSLAPGEQQLKEYAHTGFDVDWYRTITYGDGTQSERENFHSSYEARPPKYLEGKPVEEV